MQENNQNLKSWKAEFIDSLFDSAQLLDLFDQLDNVYMYIKDTRSRFVHANKVVCDVVGVESNEQMLQKTDFDFFPPAIAAQYLEEDRRVLESAKPLRDQVWLVPDSNGVPRWYLCNKMPLFNKQNQIIGIAGVKRPYEYTSTNAAGYSRLMQAVAFVTEHYSEPISVNDIAEAVLLSTSQLQREFAKNFGITPSRYIREVRIGVARHLLETSDTSLAEVASNCGFCDQSHFSRQFKSATGVPPFEYRKRFRNK